MRARPFSCAPQRVGRLTPLGLRPAAAAPPRNEKRAGAPRPHSGTTRARRTGPDPAGRLPALTRPTLSSESRTRSAHLTVYVFEVRPHRRGAEGAPRRRAVRGVSAETDLCLAHAPRRARPRACSGGAGRLLTGWRPAGRVGGMPREVNSPGLFSFGPARAPGQRRPRPEKARRPRRAFPSPSGACNRPGIGANLLSNFVSRTANDPPGNVTPSQGAPCP
jgi:hypothetical protein